MVYKDSVAAMKTYFGEMTEATNCTRQHNALKTLPAQSIHRKDRLCHLVHFKIKCSKLMNTHTHTQDREAYWGFKSSCLLRLVCEVSPIGCVCTLHLPLMLPCQKVVEPLGGEASLERVSQCKWTLRLYRPDLFLVCSMFPVCWCSVTSYLTILWGLLRYGALHPSLSTSCGRFGHNKEKITESKALNI